MHDPTDHTAPVLRFAAGRHRPGRPLLSGAPARRTGRREDSDPRDELIALVVIELGESTAGPTAGREQLLMAPVDVRRLLTCVDRIQGHEHGQDQTRRFRDSRAWLLPGPAPIDRLLTRSAWTPLNQAAALRDSQAAGSDPVGHRALIVVVPRQRRSADDPAGYVLTRSEPGP